MNFQFFQIQQNFGRVIALEFLYEAGSGMEVSRPGFLAYRTVMTVSPRGGRSVFALAGRVISAIRMTG